MILSATIDPNTLWSIGGTIIGILGIFGSFIFYKLGQRTRKLIYTVSSQPLITDNLSDLEGLQIIYQDKPIKNLTSTTIVFKSIGNENVERDDFGEKTPLYIKTTEEFLLQADMNSIVTANSNPGNSLCPVKKDDQTIWVDFEYLRKGDSITVTMLHTGNISVTGQLKSGKLQDSDTYEKFNHISNIVTGIGIGIAGILLVLVYVLALGPEGAIVDIIRTIFAFLVGMVLISYYKGNK